MSSEPRKSLCPFGVVGAPHQLDAVNASLREPLFLLLLSSAKWLSFATLVGLVSAIQLHTPDFLSYCAYMSYGRLEPVFMNALVYGWGFNAGFAVALWLMVRLSGTPLRAHALLFTAYFFWNVGLLIGIAGIIAGDQVPASLLEMPGYATPLLFIAYALIAVWGVLAYARRERSTSYISQWLVFAALFWFPWIYAAAQAMVVQAPAVGVVQHIVTGWYASAVIHLWFMPLALAAAFYLIPRVLGERIRFYYLTHFAFWLYVVVACWACGRYFIAAPVPAWVMTVTAVASVLLILPCAIFFINLLSTLMPHFSKAANSPSLRFVMTGLLFLGLYVLAQAAMMFRGLNELTQFTFYIKGLDMMGLYGGVSMIFFGAIYFLLPKLLERQWLSTSMMKTHYWGATAGMLVISVSMMVAGVAEGSLLANPDPSFSDALRIVQPWLQARSYGFILLLIGHVAFVINFHRLLFPLSQQRTQTHPTLFEAAE